MMKRIALSPCFLKAASRANSRAQLLCDFDFERLTHFSFGIYFFGCLEFWNPSCSKSSMLLSSTDRFSSKSASVPPVRCWIWPKTRSSLFSFLTRDLSN